MQTQYDLDSISYRALQLRIDSLRATTASESGHPTTCLSAADIMSTLFFSFLRYDTKNHKNPNNDRFILSKGHAAPILYAVYKQMGIISDQELLQLRTFESNLEGHPTPRFAHNEAATGSLGQGLGVGVGMALAAKLDNRLYKTYVLMGDGEIAEGSVWEAAELAPVYKLDNLIGFVDCNRLGQSGESLHNHDVSRYAKKFEAFGWNTLVIDGHSIAEIIHALEVAHKTKDIPTMIVAKTFKGYGLDAIQDKNGWHGKPIKKEELDGYIAQLKERFDSVGPENLVPYTPPLPDQSPSQEAKHITLDLKTDPQAPLFTNNKTISTRKAYGYALAALGRQSRDVVVLDADVKNSTFTDIFEKEFSTRFIQCFIAEQNMVSVATGLQARGKIPFAATFGAFLSRAFDQLRMAGIGRNALRISGSHCGVSIGQDGPSQMALEDIAMISTIPNSVIFYPSDGISTYKLVQQSANYHDGISYIRTTRADTPILYAPEEEFPIGGCKILRKSEQDSACIIAAGITVHEALKAHELLKKEGIFVAVIDLYSIKPLDTVTLLATAKTSGNHIITVEDHSIYGGMGSIVTRALINNNVRVDVCGVTHLSRSGTPEELLHDAGIDHISLAKFITSGRMLSN